MSPTTCASCQKLGSGKCPDHDIRRQGTKHQKKVDKVPTLLVSIDDPLGPIRYKIQEKVDDFTPEPNELLVVALLLSGQMIDNSLTLCKQVIANPIEYLPIANQSIDNWFNEYYSVEIEPHLLTMPNCNCSICGSKSHNVMMRFPLFDTKSISCHCYFVCQKHDCRDQIMNFKIQNK